MQSLSYYAQHPNIVLAVALSQSSGLITSDKFFLKGMYRLKMGQKLDLKNPKTFNEKLQWLKLYNRKSEYSTMVDKVAVKEYVARILGKEFIIPTLGVWDDPDKIDFDQLPQKFVLKCNHNSGTGMYICKDKSKMDVKKVKEELRKGLRQDYYKLAREWPYKNVPRLILAEEFMVDESQTELKDYKIFNFNGEPRMVQLDYNRFSGHNRNLYTPDWQLMNVKYGYSPQANRTFDRPTTLDIMLDAAKKLSAGMPFVRTDFYDVNGHVYFGELTFFPEAGFTKFTPESYDAQLGSWIQLPTK